MVKRRMIAIIREHYHGGFPRKSQRLVRTITKCARIEDSEEPEGVLMQEFFCAHYQLLSL